MEVSDPAYIRVPRIGQGNQTLQRLRNRDMPSGDRRSFGVEPRSRDKSPVDRFPTCNSVPLGKDVQDVSSHRHGS